MRFVHTADWHLGRVFHGAHLTEDQHYLLGELYRFLSEEKADCLVIAGDVYDRSVPPIEAVELLDDFIYRITHELGVRVIMSAGNHDSPERLQFASRLLTERGLVIAGSLSAEPVCVSLEDRYGEVLFYPLPYFEPARARSILGNPEIHTHAEAMEAVLSRIRGSMPVGKRSVLAAHCFTEGGSASESERPVSIGGAESVPVSVFRGFSYAALGHLHRPQSPGQSVRYSGSLMRYSFSETDHEKFFHLVEMDREGVCTVHRTAVRPRRQIRKLRGLFDDILRAGTEDAERQDYLHVELLDETPVYEAMRRLREVYPNTLHIERTVLMQTAGGGEQIDHRKTGPAELFSAFYRQTSGSDLTEEQRSAFTSVLETMTRQEQELPV